MWMAGGETVNFEVPEYLREAFLKKGNLNED
jgi:hypothetical protein